MPGKVKVKIIAGRNLPVMDRSADTTDAYVEVKLGSTTYKTDVCRKSLNPQWSSEWFRFEVDDSELQDEPLQIRLMDYDVYSANDAIGKVYLDLNPLLLPSTLNSGNAATLPLRTENSEASLTSGSVASVAGSSFSGWVPVFDTMHGIRGEVNLIVKVELFSDTNKFRQSSCGVQFFCSPNIPYGYQAQVIHGFVEELVVNDDPEYQWIDKIRTPRASNEARQTLFFKLSGEVQRRIGLKVLEMGGNAVVGYHKCFDLEGESGIVVRGIGTAVSLIRQRDMTSSSLLDELPFPAVPGSGSSNSNTCSDDQRGPTLVSSIPSTQGVFSNQLSPARLGIATPGLYRRSSDSDLNSNMPYGFFSGSGDARPVWASHRPQSQLAQENSLDMMEYPFLTMTKYPPGFILRLGGMVSSRSVKLLERTTSTEDHESRDAWWNELRMEVRSHARALACNVVLGYREQSSICEDVCVLSASGTAALISVHHNLIPQRNVTKDMNQSQDSMFVSSEGGDSIHLEDKVFQTFTKSKTSTENRDDKSSQCAFCHVPYSTTNAPMPVNLLKCAVCRQGKVPDLLLSTIEPPEGALITGRGCLIQAHVFRIKRDSRGELNAMEISNGLPFLEYELNRSLINKLRVKGMNSIFNLKVRVSIGERLLVGIATGTAVFLTALPAPPLPRVNTLQTFNIKKDADLAEMQKKLQETSKKNREQFCVQPVPTPSQEKQSCESRSISDSDESEEDLPELELTIGNKDVYVLEVVDAQDVNVVSLLIEPRTPDGFEVVNTETVPGLSNLEIVCNLQMFTQVWRARMNTCQGSKSLSKHFHRLQQSLFFKLRKMVPCAVCHMEFNVELPEQDEIQISVLGMALGLASPQNPVAANKQAKKEATKKLDEPDMIFKLDDDPAPVPPCVSQPSQSNLLRGYHTSPRERYGVDITPLSYVPGARIECYLGNLNFFFIRESTTIRECGGLSGFVHSFIAEVLAIVRAHVTALGGNAMVAYFMNECVLLSSSHKNQGQCLINVGGDVVHVVYAEK